MIEAGYAASKIGTRKHGVEEERLWNLLVPTYHAAWRPRAVERGACAEYGSPRVAIVARLEAGLRIILGTHDPEDRASPDVLVERQPHGWVLFLRPACAGDATVYVYMRDDGQTFVQPEHRLAGGPTERLLKAGQPVPGFERHPRTPGIGSRTSSRQAEVERCRSCDSIEMGSGEDYHGFCPECADRLFSRTCATCGGPVGRFGEVLHHVDEDGEIEADVDEQHAPVADV